MAAVPSATDPSPRPTKRGQRELGISWTLVNFWLDAALLVLFAALVWISFVLRFVFPAGTSAAGYRLWGYGYNDWVGLQFATLCVLLFAVLIHVMLHWTWVCGVITSKLLGNRDKPIRWEDGTRTLVGVGLIVVLCTLLGLAMAAATLMIKPPA